MNRQKWKNKNFGQALINSISGIKYVFQNERNLKIQSVFAIGAIAFGIFLKLTLSEFGILILTIGMVLFAEMINTAIEVILDLYSENYNLEIKIAKDIASGAVLLSSVMSVAIGSILFIPKILNKLI